MSTPTLREVSEAIQAWHFLLGYMSRDGIQRNAAAALDAVATGLGIELDERAKYLLKEMGLDK